MTPLTRLVSLVTVPIAFLISMSHLLGAEQGPGDGFTAGIISALALTLQYEVYGYSPDRHFLPRVDFEYVLLAGLAVALFSALLPLVAGDPVLADLKRTIEIPLFGNVIVSRALLFDIGVYLTVVGGALTAIDGLRRRET